MSSSIEEDFQPPEWATKEEVIKAAQHYINYWKIEARHRNQQWLDALQGESNAKRCEESLRGELNRKHKELAMVQSARERDVAEIHHLNAENAHLKDEVERLSQEYSDATNHYNKLHNDLQTEVNILRHQLKLCGEIEVLASVSNGKSILPEMLENARLKGYPEDTKALANAVDAIIADE